MDSSCTQLDDEISVEDFLSCIHDLNHLVRRNGEQVKFDDDLRRKYVLVFCIQRPPLYDDFRWIFPLDLVKTCSELYDLRDDFEMVVVAKTTESSVGLSNFMGVFPPQCLAVPHKDSTHRKLLCDLLRLDHPGFKCLVVNFEKNIIFNGTSAIEHLHSLRTEQPFGVKRVIKAMWPVMPELAKHPCLSEDCCPVAKQYKHVKPEYPDDIKMAVYELKKTRPIQIGHSFDVVSLLSSGKGGLNYLYRNGGNEIVQIKEETFKGKYIMVCCYHVPVFREETKSRFVQGLVTTCFDLYSTRQDFELVVVAKMNKKLANYEEEEVVFNHFMSGFPASCLVVPLSDSIRRDFICKYLDMEGHCNCLILDDNRCVLKHDLSDFATAYGADGFPFTQQHLHKLCLKDQELYRTITLSSLTLEGILQCKPSDVVDRINSAGVLEKKTISELSTKLVGLYLCVNGHFIRNLDKVYRHSKDKDLEIEIVVVYMPLGECLDPQAYKLNIDTILRRKKIDWCRLPFDNSLSLGLKRLTGCFYKDKLIIVGPCGKYVDIYGDEVIFTYGMDTYPFTREGLLQKELKKLKQVTLESLLVHGSLDYVLQGGDRIPVAQLRGKNILIYLDCLNDHEHYTNLLSWYHKMKAKVTDTDNETDTDFEVVFIRRVENEVQVAAADDDSVSAVSEMPWLVCPFEFDHSALMNKKLFTSKYESRDIMVHFGQDGQISGYPTLQNLPDHFDSDFNAFVSAGFKLREYVIFQYREEFMEGME